MNRYDFAYAGRDIVNQPGKVAPGVIKNPRSEINNVAEQRVNQIISQIRGRNREGTTEYS